MVSSIFFKDTSPIGVKGHYHVCVKIQNAVLILTYLSSQVETTRQRLIDNHIWDPVSAPLIRRDSMNRLTKPLSYVDCNHPVVCGEDEFAKSLISGDVEPAQGEIGVAELKLIEKGILASRFVEENVKDYFRKVK